jgi:acetyltransferase EpsM
MPDPAPVLIPLLNPNEPEARLASLAVNEGQWVTAGELLCILETTKSTAEMHAEGAGYICALQAQTGQAVRAGALLCYLAPTPGWNPPVEALAVSPAGLATQGTPVAGQTQALPQGLRITKPALALAQLANLDLQVLPVGPLVTESMVRQALAAATDQPQAIPLEGNFDPTAILLFGGGGHGKMLIDLISGLKAYHMVGIVDDGLSSTQQVMSLPVLGGSEVLAEWFKRGVHLAANAVGGIGDIEVRVRVFDKLRQAGFTCPVLIHTTAFVETSASLSPGVQVFAQSYVGSQVQVGFGAIISTGAIVSHDCQLGPYAILSPGATLAGEVRVGPRVLVGMRATINLQVKIGAGARIGNGATVKNDVPKNGIVRAGTIWPG